jgi:hypothetical protein
MLAANEVERGHLMGDKKYDVITRYYKVISGENKFPFALDSSEKKIIFIII